MSRISVIVAVLLMVSTLSFPSASAQVPVVVTMNALNNSGQAGQVTLTPMGAQTLVVVNVGPGPAGVNQPVHIHEGRCPNVGFVVHPLTDVVNGMSSTIVNATLQELANGSLAINVHKSVLEIGVSTSCGDIPLQ